jgi:hypothetical protein
VQPIGNGRRAFIRAAFGQSSNAFSGLTDAQIAAWTSYAEAHPITDSLGQSVKLTGHMMFVSISTQLQNISQAISSDPPTSSTVGALSSIVVSLDDTPTVMIALQNSDVDGYVLVAASRPVSAGVTFMKTFTQLAVIQPGGEGQDITDVYVAQFGTLTAGQRVFVKLTPVNSSGVTGTPSIISARVAAAGAIPTPVATSPSASTVTATWTGGGSYSVSTYADDGGPDQGNIIANFGPAVSPIASSGLTTGLKVYQRLNNGTSYGPASNSITVT